MLRGNFDQASVHRTAGGVAVTFPDALLVASKKDLPEIP